MSDTPKPALPKPSALPDCARRLAAGDTHCPFFSYPVSITRLSFPSITTTQKHSVTRILHTIVAVGLSFAACIALTACGSPEARDFGGRWKPVNKFASKVVEVPLAAPYTYYAAPVDATLKSMLARWSADTEMKLVYKLRSDFTLPRSVVSLRTSEIRDAATQLTTVYAKQGIVVRVDGPDIVVEEAGTMASPVSPAASMPPSSPAPAVPNAEDTSSTHSSAA